MRIGGNLYGALPSVGHVVVPPNGPAAYHSLLQARARLSQSGVRLSTMRRINRASDDPAGLIALEQLQSELTAVQAAGDAAARAAGAVHVADAAMSEVSDLLRAIRGNVVQAAGGFLSDAEVAAKQIEIDAALEAINRIGSCTSYNGKTLLDGSSMTFSFSPDAAQTVTLDLTAVHTSALGGAPGTLSDLAGGGAASLSSGNLADAVDVIDAAQSQILNARARAGAFEKYTIESTRRVLGSMEENLTSAVSMLGDTDVALETSRRIQSEIMVDAAMSTLVLANRRRGLAAQLLN